MFLAARRHRLGRVLRGLLPLSNQRDSLIKEGCSLADITPDFGRVGQHSREFSVELFLGFFIVFVSLADTTDQSDFFVLVLGSIDASTRSALSTNYRQLGRGTGLEAKGTDLFIVYRRLFFFLVLFVLSGVVTDAFCVILILFLLSVF